MPVPDLLAPNPQPAPQGLQPVSPTHTAATLASASNNGTVVHVRQRRRHDHDHDSDSLSDTPSVNASSVASDDNYDSEDEYDRHKRARKRARHDDVEPAQHSRPAPRPLSKADDITCRAIQMMQDHVELTSDLASKAHEDLGQEMENDRTAMALAIASRPPPVFDAQGQLVPPNQPPPPLPPAYSARTLAAQAVSVDLTSKLLSLEKQLREAIDYAPPVVAKLFERPDPIRPSATRDTHASSKKPRTYPATECFREDKDGGELSPKDKLYHADHFLAHVERLLLTNKFDVDQDLAYYVTQLFKPVEANYNWAFNHLLSTEPKYAKRRQKYLEKNADSLTPMRDFVYYKVLKKFAEPNARYSQLANLQTYAWDQNLSIPKNFETLENTALLASKHRDDDLVLLALLHSIPLVYKEKLLEYVQENKKNVRFDKAQLIIKDKAKVLAGLYPSGTNPDGTAKASEAAAPPFKSLFKRGDNANKDKGDKKRIPDAVWKLKPVWQVYMNPDHHPFRLCRTCGSSDHKMEDTACPEASKHTERRARYDAALRKWQADALRQGVKVDIPSPYVPGKPADRGRTNNDRRRDDRRDGKNRRSRSRSPRRDRDRRDQRREDHDNKRRSRSPARHVKNRRAKTATYNPEDADASSDSHDSSDDTTGAAVASSARFANSFPKARRAIDHCSLEGLFDKDEDKEITVPLLMANPSRPTQPYAKVLALGDTGCSRLQVSYKFAQRHKLLLTKPTAPIVVELAAGTSRDNPTTVSITDQTTIILKCKGKKLTCLANVTNQSDDMLLGNRERKAWNIQLTGIPLSFDAESDGEPATTNNDVPQQATAPVQMLDEADLHREYDTLGDICVVTNAAPAADRELVMAGIADVLEKQAAIPNGSFTTHPDAMVHIDTGTSTGVVRPQYPLSDAATHFVSAWLAKMLAANTITPGDPATRWLSPLLVALDRKLSALPGRPDEAGPHAEGYDAPAVSNPSSDAMHFLSNIDSPSSF